MASTNPTIDAAIEAFKPEIIGHYTRMVIDTYCHIQAKLGPEFKNVFNDWQWARTYRGLISANVMRNQSNQVVINEPELTKNAEQYAQNAIDSWKDKINSKVGKLTDVEVTRFNGYSFYITGKHNGKRILIKQKMIINVSAKGLPFNQFPANIYVDGKLTSEADYKKAQ